MLLVVALVVAVLGLLGLVVLKVSMFAIDLLIALVVLGLVWYFVRSRRGTGGSSPRAG